MEKPLVQKDCILEKYPGKGGWTYVAIPEIPQDKKAYFGWVRVRGSIDGFEFRSFNLMPMGNGCLFLSVRAEIRKVIKKQAGDTVHVILYADHEPTIIPDEWLECLAEEKAAQDFFNELPESEQKKYTDWIYSAKSEETKISRIGESIEKLIKRKKRSDP